MKRKLTVIQEMILFIIKQNLIIMNFVIIIQIYHVIMTKVQNANIVHIWATEFDVLITHVRRLVIVVLQEIATVFGFVGHGEVMRRLVKVMQQLFIVKRAIALMSIAHTPIDVVREYFFQKIGGTQIKDLGGGIGKGA